MKFKAFLFLSALMVLFAPFIGAQDITAPIVDDPTGFDFSSLDTLFTNMNYLYLGLVTLGAYLTAFIPGLKNIKDTTYRVLAWGLLTGAGFYLYGADVLTLAISYLFSNGLYIYILQLFAKTPKPDESIYVPGKLMTKDNS